MAKRVKKPALPGDLPAKQRIERAVRVDHAGEYGARRIYEGQLAVLAGTEHEPVIKQMFEQEQKHLDWFDAAIHERRIRPTLLHPLWHAAGFTLGAATALIGPKAAMACTVAVEEAIDAHYAAQAEELAEADPALVEKIEEFRADEREHRDTGLAHGAEQAPGYRLLSRAIKTGCKLAIRLSERI